jgi:hypothetical protein
MAAAAPETHVTHRHRGTGQGSAALPRTTARGSSSAGSAAEGGLGTGLGGVGMTARVVSGRYRAAMSTFTWRFEAADGSALSPPEDPGPFSSKADAEQWVGESWRDLLAHGVEQVSLLRDGEVVYPMSLRPLE